MKLKHLFLLLAAMVVLPMQAQQKAGISPVGSLNIRKEVKPAILNIVPNSIRFVDATGNNAIDANEQCKIVFQLRNDGMGDGIGCIAKATLTGTTAAVQTRNITLPQIKVGETVSVEIPISAGMNTQDGTVDITFSVDEPNGFGTDQMQMAVNTKAFVAPLLQVVDYAVTGDGASTLEKRKPFNLQLILQNTRYGKAENVQVEVIVPEGVFMLAGEPAITFGSMNAGAAKSMEYQLIANQGYAQATIPIQVKVKEKYGKYAESKTINLSLNQNLASNKISVSEIEQKQADIQIASIGSDVDKNIPVVKRVNNNTFAIIIANESYQNVASVPFALNDGNTFRQYCLSTFGIPEKNIHYLPNATGNQIKREVAWLRQITNAFPRAQIIFYYAGHGIPDENSRTAYLLPVDGLGTDVSTGYKLDDLYTELGGMPAQSITIFMDACFSGSKRENGMLASARGVALKTKPGTPQGNMVVFSAAQNDETAFPHREQGHGMFTYYLLKKLQATQGNVTLHDLGLYITTKVCQESLRINNKAQTPCVTPSPALGDTWKTWKLTE